MSDKHKPERHMVVYGPHREFDCTAFCPKHYNEALECAKEWLEEAWDGLGSDEFIDEESVTIKLEPDDGEGCCACQTGSYAEDNDG